jgi:hypothetical protein
VNDRAVGLGPGAESAAGLELDQAPLVSDRPQIRTGLELLDHPPHMPLDGALVDTQLVGYGRRVVCRGDQVDDLELACDELDGRLLCLGALGAVSA